MRFWQAQGIARVILSRELSLDEIAEIRQACPDVELEVFVHGALCIAYSGRCLLSGYFNHRDANQGSCTNACRWEYRLAGHVGEDDAPQPGRHPAADEVYLLEEGKRPGQFMPMFEDEHGTYIMNAKDLCAVEHVERLVAMGIDCLKVEGRTKSHYYVARTTQVYRQAIDDAVAGRPFSPGLVTDLEGLANRGYTEGFYRRHAPAELQNYARGSSDNQRQIFVGEVVGQGSDGWAEVEVKNRFGVGDELELLTPAGNRRFRLEAMTNRDGQRHGPGAGGGLPGADPDSVGGQRARTPDARSGARRRYTMMRWFVRSAWVGADPSQDMFARSRSGSRHTCWLGTAGPAHPCESLRQRLQAASRARFLRSGSCAVSSITGTSLADPVRHG